MLNTIFVIIASVKASEGQLYRTPSPFASSISAVDAPCESVYNAPERPLTFNVFAQVFPLGVSSTGNFSKTPSRMIKRNASTDLPFPNVLVTIDPRATRF